MSLYYVILQQLINGLILGSFYSLVALGYSMVYGIIKLLNFAHGDLYMVGAFVGFGTLGLLGGILGVGWLGIAAALLISMLAVGLLGMLVHRAAYQPLLNRRAPRMSLMITAVGVSFTLFNTVMVMTNGEYETVNTSLGYSGISLGPVNVTYTQIVMVVATALLMLALHWFIKRTMYGKAMRAIALDPDACRLMGINVTKTIGLTFFVGSSLAAAAGVMAGVYYGSIQFFMGFIIGLKAFTAAVIGGIGSIPGAMLGGLILGLLETAGTQLPFIGSAWKDVFTFGILILLLVFKPTGILGKSEIERM
ncbi:Branched-chain amino acid transport system / permease component [Acididesulfobacillus acetoxydans]|uniref:Branched-chain amino acid transport system / permease component n=1 Tax=Acididesulfobacillus acetoxydans TaxID=1561005 RepID=A0A8S0XBA1_9FIRM|nr:branched-chain amino acid ABC transporter permease [Acididesulfobacillus acetoxydans]CAA7600966.1 Branched-chain amino acid transport system / permease component [Acididesulfobacillus acetoxydans]CEJ07689.1 High-affinity branched-chain amino acid transport system permease protein BraD [Acididesulfobacillus acetoxydans]